LIAQNVIQLKPGMRGKRTKIDHVQRSHSHPYQFILKKFSHLVNTQRSPIPELETVTATRE
jgi:hypothetical protein